jgi:hypothetical protein
MVGLLFRFPFARVVAATVPASQIPEKGNEFND